MDATTYTSSSKHKQNSRNSTIDLIRLLAAFGVVFIHVHSETTAAENVTNFFLTLCVPYFFTTSLTYFTASLEHNVNPKYIVNRILKRTGIPFLAWSLVYIGLIIAKHAIITGGVRGKFTSELLIRSFLYGESAEQMYYLPELIILQFIILSICLLVNKTSQKIGLYLLIFSISYLYWGGYHNYFGINPLSSLLFYIITAFYLAPRLNPSVKRWLEIITGISLVILATTNVIMPDLSIIINAIINLPLGGLGLLLVGINYSTIHLPVWITTLSATTYGVYLSHVIFLEFIEFLIEKYQVTILYNLPTKFAITFLVFIISILFILIIKKIKLLRIILLGEK